jgi:cholesterol 7alpha-monooxygenase
MSPLQAQWAKNIFGFTDDLMISPAMGTLMADMHRHLSPKFIQPLAESLASELCAYQVHPLSEKVPLLSFVRQLAFETACKTFFGSYLSSIQDTFWAFNEHVPKVAFGYPPRLIENFDENRELIIDTLKAHLDTAGSTEVMSELVQSLHSIATSELWPSRSTARFLFALLWPLTANVPFAIYWVLTMQLRHERGLTPLTEEVDAARKKFTSLSQFLASKEELPWLEAAIHEALRFASSSYSMRQVVKEGGVMLGKHFLKEGEHLVCVTRSAHLNPAVYSQPESYKPERFLTEDGRFQTLSSNGCYLPFGGGISTV